jgi:hypothetical protein
MANNQLQHTDILDDYDLSFGTDRDIRCRYDEATDNRLEWHDGTNILAYLSDLGTTGLFGVTGRIECPQIGISADTDLLALAADQLTVAGAVLMTQLHLTGTTNPLIRATGATDNLDIDHTHASQAIKRVRIFRSSPIPSGVCEFAVYSPNTNTQNFLVDAKTGNTTLAGALTAASDTDSTHTFGRSRLASYTSDTATWSHIDYASAGGAALRQNSFGTVELNAASTRTIVFKINDTNITQMTSTLWTYADAVNMAFNATTGTKIGTATSQKIGFWNATPIIQPASANQAALSLDVDVTGADTVDKAAVNANFTSIQTLVNQLRSDMVAAGLIKGAA